MIYLDNAATTRPDEECLGKAQKYITETYYNPSALYVEGYNIRGELNSIKEEMLSFICSPSLYEIIFTSCGTEADNQALFCGVKRGNLVTTEGEHSAVYNTAKELSRRGTDVRFAPLKADGSVDDNALLSLVDGNTSLVSVIHVNNETGSINDIAKIANGVKKKAPKCLFHADGVQSFGKIKFKLTGDIDMYSLSAHKIGGMKGCGALIKKKSVSLNPYIYGGGQENGMRSGTENVFGIEMMYHAAAKRYKNLDSNFEKVTALNGKMRDLLDKSLFEIISSPAASPYILCVSAPGVRGETLLHEADDEGLIIGTGSACSSNDKKRYSRVILSCGITGERADGIIRISFSPDNTDEEIETAAGILNRLVKARKDIMA